MLVAYAFKAPLSRDSGRGETWKGMQKQKGESGDEVLKDQGGGRREEQDGQTTEEEALSKIIIKNHI